MSAPEQAGVQEVLDLFGASKAGVVTAPVGSTAVDERFVRAVAEQVADVLARRSRANSLLTVTEIAARLRVHPSWVYANAARLGAIRLGDGPKAALRFDFDAVIAALMVREPRPAPSPARRSRPRLLPVREP